MACGAAPSRTTTPSPSPSPPTTACPDPGGGALERSGFARFGMAPNYLHIAGQWQDHVLYQLLNSAST